MEGTGSTTLAASGKTPLALASVASEGQKTAKGSDAVMADRKQPFIEAAKAILLAAVSNGSASA